MALTDSGSKVMGAVSVLADLVLVNVLFILTSLPVVMAGAAMSAAHGVLLEVAANEGGGRTRSFFGHFRRSFLVATAGWLPLLALGGFLVWEYWAIGQMTGWAAVVAMGAGIAVAVLAGLWAVWFFPLASMGRGLWPTVKTAGILSFAKLGHSLAGLFVLALPALFLLLAPGSWPIWVVAFAAIGFALLCYLIDLLIAGVLRRITAPAAG